MDKIILNNGTSLDFYSVNILTDGLAFTFTGQTLNTLETLMTKSNLTVLKLANSDNEVYGTYNNLDCLSIAKIISSGNIVVTLYQENATEERLTTLEQQNSEMLLALVQGGLM